MITPTVGRVVWFHLNGSQRYPSIVQRDQPLDAHVVYVWNDRMINVAGFDVNGDPFKVTSVRLVQDGDFLLDGVRVLPASEAYCEWMPYQKGQAAKAEAAEKQATAA